MINQNVSEIAQNTLYPILIGFAIAIVLVLLIVWANERNKEMSKPILIFIDLTDGKIYKLGYFESIKQAKINVENGNNTVLHVFVSKIINSFNVSKYIYLISAYGEISDLAITGLNSNPIILIGKMYGNSQNAYSKFMKDVFSPQSYDFNYDNLKINKSIYLCKPIMEKGIRMKIFMDNMNVISDFFTMHAQRESNINNLMHLVINDTGKTISSMAEFFSNKQTELFNSFLVAWNALFKVIPTSTSVIAKLLHIRIDTINASGINQALNSGSPSAIFKFENVIKDLKQNIIGDNSLIIDKNIFNQTMDTANKIKNENEYLKKKLDELENEIGIENLNNENNV